MLATATEYHAFSKLHFLCFLGPATPFNHGKVLNHTCMEDLQGRRSTLTRFLAAKPQPGPSAAPQHLCSHWFKAQGIGCGLQNLGNTCYLNSVIQCLAHLPPLANLCLRQQHSRSCSLQEGSCTCCNLEKQVYHMLNRGSSAAMAPHSIHRSLRVLNRNFIPGRQEDSHELLRCLVETLEKDLLKHAGLYNPSKPPKVRQLKGVGLGLGCSGRV